MRTNLTEGFTEETIELALDNYRGATPDIEEGGAFNFFVCGSCRSPIKDHDKYCRECGKRVVWE